TSSGWSRLRRSANPKPLPKPAPNSAASISTGALIQPPAHGRSWRGNEAQERRASSAAGTSSTATAAQLPASAAVITSIVEDEPGSGPRSCPGTSATSASTAPDTASRERVSTRAGSADQIRRTPARPVGSSSSSVPTKLNTSSAAATNQRGSQLNASGPPNASNDTVDMAAVMCSVRSNGVSGSGTTFCPGSTGACAGCGERPGSSVETSQETLASQCIRKASRATGNNPTSERSTGTRS